MEPNREKPAEDSAEEAAEDFGTLFEQSVEETLQEVRPGEVVKGNVVDISSDFVTVDIGYKSEGQIPRAEFEDYHGDLQVSVGDDVDVFFGDADTRSGGISLSRRKAEQMRVWGEVEKAFEAEEPVDGRIVGRVKGGLKVDIGVNAFLPGSHVDIRPSRNLDRYIGESGRFTILKFNRARGNVVVSRRAILEKEREAMKGKTLEVLEEGVILEGTVKNLTTYGAFVDLGGIDGLLHVTDMSWGRVSHPSDVVEVGATVKVVVLKYDPEKERVSLGMKQILPDPWVGIDTRFPPGSRVRGKVVSLVDYGAFVELEKGLEGLIHVSEMSWTRRINHPKEVLSEGEEVDVAVLDIDPMNRRISLGLKQAGENPWEVVRVNHPVGSKVKGVIKSITDFGVFVGIEEGVDGLVHVSDIDWTRKIKHPNELYEEGQELEAVVLSVDVENQRMSLGVKQLQGDPWIDFSESHPVHSRVHGKVSSLADFGIFVKLAEGVEGLVHISQIANERVERPEDLYSVGDEIEAEIVSLDPKDRRIGLSVKALRTSEEREAVDAYMREERERGRFSFSDILSNDLPLDRDDSEGKGRS